MAAVAAGHAAGSDTTSSSTAKHRPFADLEALLKKDE
jgi:hypothetical protein